MKIMVAKLPHGWYRGKLRKGIERAERLRRKEKLEREGIIIIQ